MTRFTALGDIDLRSADGVLLGSVLNQPRRLALLAYVALESERGGVQRDRLIGVFWPDLPQAQARQSLRTALHFLRRSLGADTFGGQGTSITVNPDAVSCDATEFRAALAGGDAEGALRAYRGDFLPGFHLEDGPPEFENWLTHTREELRRSAAEAAWSLAVKEDERGNAPGAGAWARRASRLYEWDEAAARRSIELLGRIGDRAGALEVYQDLVRRLRDEFDAEPSARTRAAMAALESDDVGAGVAGSDARSGPEPDRPSDERVPARAADEEESRAMGVAETPATGAGRATPATGWRRLARTGYSTAVTAVLVIAFYSLWGGNRTGRDAEASAGARGPLIEVEELRGFSSGPATASLASALTTELTGRLSESEALRVVAVTQVAATPDRRSATRPSYRVRGGVLRTDSTLRVTAILMDGASGATLDRIAIERPVDSRVDELAETMAQRVRRQVGRAVDDHERGATSTHPQALRLVRAAVRDIEVADSLTAAGVAEPADLAFEAADSQLALAREAAPRWAEPSVLRAVIAYRRMWAALVASPGDPAIVAAFLRTGIDHADAAVVVAPDEPAALELRGTLRYWLWLTRSAGSEAAGRDALLRAEADLRRATTLDAGRGLAWSTLSAILESRADFAAANLAAGRAYRADPYLQNASETLVRLFVTSLEVGDRAAARQWCDELAKRLRDSRSWLPGYCTLMQLAWHGPPTGMDTDSLDTVIDATLTDAPDAAPVRARLRMIGAVALARAGSPAAGPMIESAKATAPGDPDLAVLEAWARVVQNDLSAATALLASAAEQDPRAAPSMLQSRRFDGLRDDPRLAALVSATRP